jgi:nucleoside-diphosphate-sugar epimerase
MTQDQKTALITGGGGFIGRRLADRLTAEGYAVRGLDLSDGATRSYAALRGELIVGDLLAGDALARAADGADLVIHTAARMGIDDDWAGYRAINVEGSARVAAAARAAGASAFVQFSSVMVYGFDFPDGVAEDGPLDGADNPYCQTKIESEAAVLEQHRPGTFDVYVIRPGDVYGPGCDPWVRAPIGLMQAGQWAWLTEDPDAPTVHNHVYVDNLIDGILAVLAAGRSGEPFNITDGARTTARSFFGYYERLLGLALAEMTVDEALALGQPEVWMKYLGRHASYSIDKIRSLGYEPRIDLDEGMANTARWLRDEGTVPDA